MEKSKSITQYFISSTFDNFRDYWQILAGMITVGVLAKFSDPLQIFLTSLCLWFIIAGWCRTDKNSAIHDLKIEHIRQQGDVANQVIEKYRLSR